MPADSGSGRRGPSPQRQPALIASKRQTEAVEPAQTVEATTTSRPAEAGAGQPAARTVRPAARVLDRPGRAPELLALAAVDLLGPRAQDWVTRTRESYPTATPDGLARLATRRFARLAGAGGALAAVSGLFAPVAELATLSWTQAGVVLHIAAAYGADPSAPERAVDLLVLTQVHPDAPSARAALGKTADDHEPENPQWRELAAAAWRLTAPLAGQTGSWLAVRLAARAVPGAGLIAAAAGDAAAIQRLATRATTRFRTVDQTSESRSDPSQNRSDPSQNRSDPS